MVAFTSGAVLTAAALNTAFNTLTTRTVTATTDTLVLADQGGLVTYNNASAVTVTVPTNASVAYATGTVINLLNLGAGTVTVSGAGVTLNGTATISQNSAVTIIKTATNTWSIVSGAGLPKASVSSTTGSPTTGANGSKTYYKFTGTGTVTFGTGGLLDILLVGGGGGGGAGDTTGYYAGGAGAGGFVYQTNVYVPAGTYTVTVGAGGTAATTSAIGSNGGTTYLNTLPFFAVGGGYGGQAGNNANPKSPILGGNGGSAGGNGHNPASQGSVYLSSAIPTQGNIGGVTEGGGGGAGAAGTTGRPANGGAGLANSITGASITYAAGGGVAAGTAGAAGAANTGNGGGGGSNGGYSGGAGGTGVAILLIG